MKFIADKRCVTRSFFKADAGPYDQNEIRGVYDENSSVPSCEKWKPQTIFPSFERILSAFTLNEIVPWGRSYEEYWEMFALTEKDLEEKILGCADGPASFNATLSARGGTVVSVDPLYRFSGEEVQSRIDQVFDTVLNETRKNAHEFVWTTILSVDNLGQTRRKARDVATQSEPYAKGRDR